MERLSLSLTEIKPHYAVVVVGSGYGGAIAASRLARAGQSVCLLERGREIHPGEFPDTPIEAAEEFQLHFAEGELAHLGSRTALFDMRVQQEMNVLVACGLGGTSLINANVAEEPDQRVFEDPVWPSRLRSEVNTTLRQGYARARHMLGAMPYPEDSAKPAKLSALEASARANGWHCYRPAQTVTFHRGTNRAGIAQEACTLCGDCVAGCNVGAKNSTLMNYLPDARRHGAEIFSGASVSWIERREGHWLIHYQALESGREAFDAPELIVAADMVFLGAGSLGTTEILLRSRHRGLPLSNRLGHRFTGNGDALGYGYNCDRPVNGIGSGADSDPEENPVGPCITGLIDLRAGELEQGMVIEEGALPSAMAPLLPAAFAAASKVLGRDTDREWTDGATETRREWESLALGPYRGAVASTQTFLVMAHDDAGGRMALEDERLVVSWPGVGERPLFKRIEDRLVKATAAIGGTYVPNPLWSKLLNRSLITVHPLGGCAMGEEADTAVTNHLGQVFAGSEGTDLHPGLFVCDGALMPRSLGINPLLTISALAERNCALIAEANGWSIDFSDLPPAAREKSPQAPSLQFTEAMAGHITLDPQLGYEEAETRGKAANHTLEFTVTVVAEDVTRLLEEPSHKAKLFGSVTAPDLSSQPLTVSGGQFALLVEDEDATAARRMDYRMDLTARDGEQFRLLGFKRIHDDPGFDLWADTTTLFVDLYRGDVAIGRGVLHIRPADFLRQLATLKVTGTDDNGERLTLLARFGRFFAGSLFDVYGRVLVPPEAFDPKAPPRRRRPLRTGIPEVHVLMAEDGVRLNLTRYRGGGRGPVLLSHGLGGSSRTFSLDTVPTNLVEYLYAHGFDTWLLDHRASILLPSAATAFSMDDVALKDYPAALRAIRRITGEPEVDVVAHCLGSAALMMALLAGQSGVRSAACSQAAVHMAAPALKRFKAGLHLPSMLDALGISHLSAYTDSHADWFERLFNRALQLQPLRAEERCRSAVCHRITFLFGPSYEHARLNRATHDTLHELFGSAGMRAMEQLSRMIRAGHLVDKEGRDAYLRYPERLALPITFIHGAENQCYLPQGTEKTLQWLSMHNDQKFYRSHLIPGFGHIDCLIGHEAVEYVYPLILRHLEWVERRVRGNKKRV